MIRRKYANMRIYEDNIDFADVENTITYSLSAKNLENNLNKREEELCNKIADLEAKLAECEKSKELYRLQNEHHHLQLLQFYSRLGVEAFGADIHEKALETLMIMKEQLAITEKALELACERVKYFEEMQDKEMGFYEFFGYDSDYDLKAIIEQYKQQAKEMLENE